MMITATGILQPPDMLIYLIGSSTTWQSLCGVDSEAESRDFCHLIVYDTEDVDAPIAKYPRAIVNYLDNDAFSFNRIARAYVAAAGTLSLAIELQLPSGYTRPEEETWFRNQIGAIIDEMLENSAEGEPIAGYTHLNVTGITRGEGPYYPDDNEVELQDPEMFEQQRVAWVILTVEYQG
jgi:hypothetical protein